MYELVVLPEAQAGIDALSDEAFNDLQELLMDHVRNNPWDGVSEHKENPDGTVRRWQFGPGRAGFLVYQIVEREQNEVHLLRVIWAA